MNKPQPKKNLVISQVSRGTTEVFCVIHAITKNARDWLENNAPEFGNLSLSGSGRYHFYLQERLYDVDEVLNYIEKMGGE